MSVRAVSMVRLTSPITTTRRAPPPSPLPPDGTRGSLCLCGYRGSVSVRALLWRRKKKKKNASRRSYSIFLYSLYFLEFVSPARGSQRFSRDRPLLPPLTNESICSSRHLDPHAYTHISAYARSCALARDYTLHTHTRRVFYTCYVQSSMRQAVITLSIHSRSPFVRSSRTSVKKKKKKEIIDYISVSPRYMSRYSNTVCRSRCEITARRGRAALCFV